MRNRNDRFGFTGMDQKSAQDLLTWLQQHNKQEAQQLQDAINAQQSIDNIIDSYCSDPRTFAKFVQLYIGTIGRLNYIKGKTSSLDVIARFNNLKVYILRRSQQDPGVVELMHQTSGIDSARTVYLLEINDTLHYNLLTPVMPDGNPSGIQEVSSDKELSFVQQTRPTANTNTFYTGLSVDGGGIGGLMPALLLREMEEITNKPISALFDCVGGTSIGGIITLFHAVSEDGYRPLYSSQNVVDLFYQHGRRLFPRSKRRIENVRYAIGGYTWSARYSATPLEHFLAQHFRDLCLSDTLTNVLVTAADLGGQFYTFESRQAQRFEYFDYHMRDVARSTSVMPTYFPSAKITNIIKNHEQELVDASIWLNNPSRLVHDRIVRQFNVPADNIRLVSLGTGKYVFGSERPARSDDVQYSVASSIIDAMQSSSDRVDGELQTILKPDRTYYRLQPRLEQEIDLTDPSEDNLKLLEQTASQRYAEIRGIARKLAENADRKRPGSW